MARAFAGDVRAEGRKVVQFTVVELARRCEAGHCLIGYRRPLGQGEAPRDQRVERSRIERGAERGQMLAAQSVDREPGAIGVNQNEEARPQARAQAIGLDA